jgi:hypothetical protein
LAESIKEVYIIKITKQHTAAPAKAMTIKKKLVDKSHFDYII